MKLAEIVTELKALKSTVADFISGKVTATTDLLASFQTKLTSLETAAVSELTQAQADLGTARQSISTLETGRVELQGQLTTANGEITTLKASLEAEKKRTDETLAAMGVDPKTIPGAPAGAGPGKAVNMFAQYQELLATDPQEAGRFYAANADQILKDRKPKK